MIERVRYDDKPRKRGNGRAPPIKQAAQKKEVNRARRNLNVERMRVGLESLIRSRIERRRSRPIQAADIFRLSEQAKAPPPGVLPRGGKARIAQDQASIGNMLTWASNAIPSSFLEGVTWLGYAYLSELAQRPEYRRLTEVIAKEMTRKWIRFQGKGGDDAEDKTEKIDQLNEEFTRLKVKEVFCRVAEMDGFFGRGHIYIDTGSTEDRDELKLPIGDGKNLMSRAKFKGKIGFLRALRPIEPIWCYPTNYNAIDPLKSDWYNPADWFVMGKQIHADRLLKFVGREVPDILKPAYVFGGLSMSQMAKPYVDIWLRTREAVAELIEAFSIFVLKTDLSESLNQGGEELFERVELFNNLRFNAGLMMLNKDSEDFTNISAPLGSLDVLQAQSQEHMASVSGIPIVKLLGISPHGLNASSEGEIRVWYDWIHSFQESFFTENLWRVVRFAQLSLWGAVDEDITFSYEPLWALDEKSMAELRKTEADTDLALIGGGVLAPEESRRRIASDANTPYASLDVDDVPDLREEEMEGLVPKGGGAATKELFEEEGEEGEDPHGKKTGGEAPEGFVDGNPGDPEVGEAGKDTIIPFGDEAEFKEEDHPRGEGGKFTSGAGSSGSATEPEAQAEGGPKYGKHGGRYITSGGSPKENHDLTINKWLNEPPKINMHYRNTLMQLIKEGPGFGTAIETISKLKSLLIQSLQKTMDKYNREGRTKEVEALQRTLDKIKDKAPEEFKKAQEPVAPPPIAPSPPKNLGPTRKPGNKMRPLGSRPKIEFDTEELMKQPPELARAMNRSAREVQRAINELPEDHAALISECVVNIKPTLEKIGRVKEMGDNHHTAGLFHGRSSWGNRGRKSEFNPYSLKSSSIDVAHGYKAGDMTIPLRDHARVYAHEAGHAIDFATGWELSRSLEGIFDEDIKGMSDYEKRMARYFIGDEKEQGSPAVTKEKFAELYNLAFTKSRMGSVFGGMQVARAEKVFEKSLSAMRSIRVKGGEIQVTAHNGESMTRPIR